MSWLFGEYLQRLLDQKEWTASRLAKKANLSHVYMGHLLKGERTECDKRTRISVDTITALSQALEIPEYKLLLAYKGIDPDNCSRYPQEGYDIYAEIYTAAETIGFDLNHLALEDRHKLESLMIRMSRKLLQVLVEEEVSKLKPPTSPPA